MEKVAAGAVVLAVVAVFAWLAADNVRLRAELANAQDLLVASDALGAPREAGPVPAASPAFRPSHIVRLELPPVTARGNSEPVSADIPEAAGVVEVILPVDTMFPAYRVVLDGPGGRVWAVDGAVRDADGLLHVWIAGVLMADGVYTLRAFGGTGDKSPLIAGYSIEVRR